MLSRCYGESNIRASPMMCKLWLLLILGCVVCSAFGQVPDRAYVDAAMRQDGDVSRGSELFADGRAGCIKCHTMDGSSGHAGPDLFAVGDKFPRRELIRSILEPSAE